MTKADPIARALASHRAGRLQEAAALYQRILQDRPDHFDALHLLGTVAYQQGEDGRAVELIRRALAIDDRQAIPHHHLGLALLRQGRREEAVDSFRRAAELDPGPTLARSELAETLLVLGRTDEAATAFRDVLALAPDRAEAHRGLADTLHQQGMLAQAVVSYRQAVTYDETSVRAWWGLGCALLAQKDYANAAASLRRVVELAPKANEAYHNLGTALFELGEVDQALGAFRRAEALHPHEKTREMIATIIPGSSLADSRAILEARRAWAESLPKGHPAPVTTPRRADSTGQPLRVGYVSAFFHHRNWMKPVWGLINQHDRDQFEIHLFSDAPQSSVQHGYHPHPRDRFHDITRCPNAEVARLIQEQGIDLLIDLNGYSRPARLGLFALRPAPVQVGWFNLFATSGMNCFDGLIGDEHVLPGGEDAEFSEPLVRVPGCYLTFEVSYPVPEVAPVPSQTREGLTFGCLAPQYKITPQVVATWARILRDSPTSRLFLKNTVLGSAAAREFVWERFARLEVPRDRVELEGPAEHHAFLERYSAVDLALDTFPYNGGTTTMEALWQGVPVLTFAGDRWASRISASLLRTAGLPEYVAEDQEDYVNTALDLARDPTTPTRLAELRQTLRDRLRRSVACDLPTFAREMERLYLDLWRRSTETRDHSRT